MGGGVRLPTTPAEVLHKINSRFAPGEPLKEMVTIQKEFQVFHPKNSLQQAYRLLDLGPSDYSERRLYHQYLDRLKKVPSDIDGMNGHDRIIKARQENLESSNPLPMYAQTHLASEDKRVKVTVGSPTPYHKQDHVIISTPMIPFRTSAGPKRAAPKKKGP